LFWHNADSRVDRVLPFDDFAGISSHAAEDRGHAARGAILGFVVGLVIPDGIEQVIVLLLIRVFPSLANTPGILASSANNMPADIAIALRANSVFGHAAPAAVNVPALTEAARAVRIFELDTMM